MDTTDVARGLKEYVRGLKPPVVGAYHVTCSDGAEHECAEAFQHELVQDLLPAYTFLSKGAFRTANLGARYEWSAVRIAESHFAGAAPGHAYKLMVVKINTHVAWDATPEGPVFGPMRRFDTQSIYCGALHALLEGRRAPFLYLLRETFQSAGVDRLAILNDPERVHPQYRSLAAAALGARLQARQALLDIQDYTPLTPTIYLVLACVSLNRIGRSAEIVCGSYHADVRGSAPVLEYVGLGDDPSRYRIEASNTGITIEDPEVSTLRPAYDYRRIIGEGWRAHPAATAVTLDTVDVREHRVVMTQFFQELLASSPRDGALLAFAAGLAPIYDVHRAFRVLHGSGVPGDAAVVVQEGLARLAEFPEEAVNRAWDTLSSLVNGVDRAQV
jgi:hypothetical protein